MAAKILPRDITSYDLLKAFALITMLVDHVGFFFYPDELWWRMVGRLSAPAWFFLIGYAEARKVQPQIWIGGAIVAASRMISGGFFFPMNVLFSLAACRLLIDGVMIGALRSYQAFWGAFLALFFMAMPTMTFFEYGSLGMTFAMFGFIVRHKGRLNINPRVVDGFAAAVTVSYIFYQLLLFMPSSPSQILSLFTGMLALCFVFLLFRPVSFPRLTQGAGVFAPAIRFMGRRTLELYVAHLVVFAGLAMWLDPARFGFMKFQWAEPGMLSFFATPGG